MMEQLRKKSESNILMYCLFMIVSYIFTLIELVTKFATVSSVEKCKLSWNVSCDLSLHPYPTSPSSGSLMPLFLLPPLQVRLAITGESFIVAGRQVTDLLSRNFLDTFGVWWFPPMVRKVED